MRPTNKEQRTFTMFIGSLSRRGLVIRNEECSPVTANGTKWIIRRATDIMLSYSEWIASYFSIYLSNIESSKFYMALLTSYGQSHWARLFRSDSQTLLERSVTAFTRVFRHSDPPLTAFTVSYLISFLCCPVLFVDYSKEIPILLRKTRNPKSIHKSRDLGKYPKNRSELTAV